MSKTLLDGVNAVLKKVGMIAGDAGTLASLTDSGRQVAIDLAVEIIGEGVDELFRATGDAVPLGQGESFITLATSARSYSLAVDLVRLRWPFVDKTNGTYILEFAGGYNELLVYDPRQSFTGLPYRACINPVTDLLYMDRTPTVNENGRVYTYQYDKDLTLSAATDVLPFNNTVFRAMVPAWTQLWRRDKRGQKDFDPALFATNIGRAARLLNQVEPRKSYSPRRGIMASR
jgi:hypothetical protein